MNKVTSKDGTSIAFDKRGTGPALIFVGGATSDRSATVELAEQLAPHFTTYGFDRRGRGDSGDTAPYAVEREIEDIDAMLDAAGGSAFLFGHSSGAVLSLRATEKLGNKIPKLAIYEPPFIIDDSRPPLPNDYVEHLNELIAAGRKADALEYFMTVAVNIPAQYIEGMKGSPMWESSVAVAHTIAYDGAIMGDTMWGDPATLDQFATIDTPTLVMDGSESPAYQHNGVKTLTAILPNAQHRTLAGQDHGAAADVLGPILVEFFLR